MSYDPTEQDALIDAFVALLKQVTRDGGRKRAAGLKPPWWKDKDHEKAIFSHLNKWKHGERTDKDSGAHPLVHLAWRALAIAYQESVGEVDPQVPHLPQHVCGLQGFRPYEDECPGCARRFRG